MGIGKLLRVKEGGKIIKEVYGGDLFITGEAHGFFLAEGEKLSYGEKFERLLLYRFPSFPTSSKFFYLGVYFPQMINGSLYAMIDLGGFRWWDPDTLIQVKAVEGKVRISIQGQLCLRSLLTGKGAIHQDLGREPLPVENCARDIIDIGEADLEDLVHQAEEKLLTLFRPTISCLKPESLITSRQKKKEGILVKILGWI